MLLLYTVKLKLLLLIIIIIIVKIVISIIYGPDRTNGPEEGLVRATDKKGPDSMIILNGPDCSSIDYTLWLYRSGNGHDFHSCRSGSMIRVKLRQFSIKIAKRYRQFSIKIAKRYRSKP